MLRWVPAILALVLAAQAIPSFSPEVGEDAAVLALPLAPPPFGPEPADTPAPLEGTRDIGSESAHIIRGRILEAATKVPLEGAHVELSPGSFEATTDTDGSYLFEVPSGAYLLRATEDGHRASWARLLPALPGSVVTKDLYLVPDTTYGGRMTIHVPADIPTIQDAVHAASDGDEVRVAPGHYRERVFLERSISIVGGSAGNTIIDARGIGSVIAVAAPNVTIRGLTITRGNWGVYVQEDGLTIADSIIYLNQQGLLAAFSNDGVVERVAFLDNWQRAFQLFRATGYVFHHNTFLGNGELAYLFEARGNRFYSNDILGDPGGFAGDPELQNPWDNAWSLNGRGNYWESYRGRDLDGDGVGDTDLPHASVDIHPLVGPAADGGAADRLDLWVLPVMAAAFLLLVVVPRTRRRLRLGER